ncbi:MAG: hypothetical protein AB8A40_03960 [Prochlorococcus sp.]
MTSPTTALAAALSLLPLGRPLLLGMQGISEEHLTIAPSPE